MTSTLTTRVHLRYQPASDVFTAKVAPPTCPAHHHDHAVHEQPDDDLAVEWCRHGHTLHFKAAVVVFASQRVTDPVLDCLPLAVRRTMRRLVTSGLVALERLAFTDTTDHVDHLRSRLALDVRCVVDIPTSGLLTSPLPQAVS